MKLETSLRPMKHLLMRLIMALNRFQVKWPNSKEHLLLAARYANSEISSLPDAAKFCAEAFLHAAIACYAQANGKWLAGDADAAREVTEEALTLARKAMEIYPQLTEAYYNHAKFAALLGQGETAAKSLKAAILGDRNYCLKADTDKDFDGVREHIRSLFVSLRKHAQEEAERVLASTKRLLEDWVYLSPETKAAKARIRDLLGQAESLYRRNTYFGYLDVLALGKEAQETLDRITLTALATLEGYSAVFSPDGRYLVSGGSDTVKVYQLNGLQEVATLVGHSVVFLPDGTYLATRSYGYKVRIWYRGIISRQEFEEEEKRRQEAQEAEAAERRMREHRMKNKLCLTCGNGLSVWGKLKGEKHCKKCRK
jgi:tetratricopeptide (TPR) repeat protein